MLTTGPAPLLFKINGLPAHALLVHAAVVLVPIAALGAIAYLVPRWRDWLRWPLLVAAVLALAFTWAAYLSGENFVESVPALESEQIKEHEEYAEMFRLVGSAFAVVAIVVTAWLHRRAGVVRMVGSGVAAALAVVTLVYVVLTGEAGAKAVYPPASFDSQSAPPSAPDQ